MGANHFLDLSDKEAMTKGNRQFDFILCTANAEGQDWNSWLSLVELHGTFCVVSAPEAPLQLSIWPFLGSQLNFCGSGIGSILEIQQMLAFSARWNITPIIERLPMEKANEGIEKVRDGSVRFRVVLENAPKK